MKGIVLAGAGLNNFSIPMDRNMFLCIKIIELCKMQMEIQIVEYPLLY